MRQNIEEESIYIDVGDMILEWYPPKFGRWKAPDFEDGGLRNGDPGGAAIIDVELCSIADGDVSGIENWPPLRRDWWVRARTMCIVRAVWRRCLCLTREILVAGVGWPSARAKTLVYLKAVGMNLPPSFPAFEVHTVSHAPEGMEIPRTTCFSRCSEIS